MRPFLFVEPATRSELTCIGEIPVAGRIAGHKLTLQKLADMKLGVIGAGPVGLVTAGAFSSLGHQVLCVEKDPVRLKQLTNGSIPLYEPGLQELVQQGVDKGSLNFTDDMGEVLRFANVVFVCVGTPEGEEGAADLSQVESVAVDVARNLPGYRLLIEKSTVPIGTHRHIARTISRHAGRDAEFDVACIPEFLREGNAVHDFFNPDRIIIGVGSDRSRALIEDLYSSFDCEKVWTDPGTAELVKHASNAFLALKISYSNLLADMSEATGANLGALLDGVGGDSRIGRSFLNPGVGYGGSCLPKDVRAFVHFSTQAGVDSSMLAEAQKINERRPVQIVDKVRDALWLLNDKPVTVWGLSFKPETDDVRNAPSLDVVRQLLEAGAKVTCHDPVAISRFREAFDEHPDLRYEADMYEAAQDSHALILLTEWSQYKDADLAKVRSSMTIPLIIDGRRVFDPEMVDGLGFEYEAFGSGKRPQRHGA